MCGIAGIISATQTTDPAALQRMTDALQHRGPDGEGHWSEEDLNVQLGHRRLAILDLSDAGAQPMHYNDRYVIVHNGEIYNYDSQRNASIQEGCAFRSQTDTEVILAQWSLHQTMALQHFDGMFAFALWDRATKELFLVRDRYGEKPLYYNIEPEKKRLVFASEIKAIEAFGIEAIVDPEAMLRYLGAGIVHNDPEKTYYKNIVQVPPGHVLRFSLETGAIQISAFFDPNKKSEEQPLSKQEFLIKWEESIRARMRTDVSIGTSLSGGLDSSSIIAMIHQLKNISPHYSHQSFTAAFRGFEKNEFDSAQQIADRFDLQATYIEPSADTFAEEIEAFILHHEEPIQSASAYAQYKVFEAAKHAGIKVMLDGQGADELLGGYTQYWPWYFQELLRSGAIQQYHHELKLSKSINPNFHWSAIHFIASFFPQKSAHVLEARTKKQILQNKWLHPDFKNQYKAELNISKPVIRNLNDLLRYHTYHAKLPELLRYADKNSMAHGVEVRLPYLANHLSERLLQVPSCMKLKDGYTKWMLRYSMDTMLPKEIVWNRNKIGFEPPQKTWMAHPLVQQKITKAKEKLVAHQILAPEVLSKPIAPHHAYDPKGMDWRFLVAGTLIQ